MVTRVSRRDSGGLRSKRLHFDGLQNGRAAVEACRATRCLGADWKIVVGLKNNHRRR